MIALSILHIYSRIKGVRGSPRGSSCSFLLRSGAREVAAEALLALFCRDQGRGGRRGALLALFCRDRGRGRSPRGSSCSFLLRSRAREVAARLFLLFSAEIGGVGGRHVALLALFCRDRGVGGRHEALLALFC